MAAPIWQFVNGVLRLGHALFTAGNGGALYQPSGVLAVSTTEAQTGANTNETDLWTYTLPANTLAADGAGVRISYELSFAANANAKTVRFYSGSQAVQINVTTTSPNGVSLTAETRFVRVSATVGRIVRARASVGSANQSVDWGNEATHDFTAPIVIKVTGQNGTANAGDIVFRGAIVEALV